MHTPGEFQGNSPGDFVRSPLSSEQKNRGHSVVPTGKTQRRKGRSNEEKAGQATAMTRYSRMIFFAAAPSPDNRHAGI